MTTDDILRAAVECQLVTTGNRDGVYADALIRFARLVQQQALAEPEQEPVAWLYKTPLRDGSFFVGASAERLQIGVGVHPDSIEQPLYTAPQPAKREPLTDEEIKSIFENLFGYFMAPTLDDKRFARAVIEAYERKQQGETK